MAIGPWVLLIIYDAILYLFRTATYEIPYIGGRARNRPRPRAPSLRTSATGESTEMKDHDGLKNRGERNGHQRTGSTKLSEE
ncbi:hypothetical protein BGZ60DRAFT_530207 [Tricladium varicosporioides]|nr:hypothetical protein BGZ60DRAFT_530207 [Hymenoscyphus varicosporioides]